MTPQTARITFFRSSLLLFCGLSSLLAFHQGCAVVGSSSGSDGSTVTGGTSCVGVCTNISEQTIKELKSLGITQAALDQFFNDLGRKKIPPEQLDHELRDIAKNYLDLKAKLATLSSEDPEVAKLTQQARQAVDAVNFSLAEWLFNEASQRDEQAAQHLQQVATIRLISAAATQAANGDLHMVQLNFVKAQAYYQKALQVLPSFDKEHRGQYLLRLGISLRGAGIRTKGADIQKFLRESVQAYRDALTVYTKEALPQDWAMTQNNLGAVLGDQGTRVGGEAGTQLLAQAVEAYRDALTVYTKEALPQDWAMTQNNLGTVLQQQGSHATGEAGTRLFAESVTAYRAALTVYMQDQFSQQWATSQNNLGNVLGQQGIRSGGEAGTRFLAEAVIAYRAALTVYTKDKLPQEWAMTQNNLGAILRNQGIRTTGEAGTYLLAEAVTAYRAALMVYTQDQLPQQWAMIQNNLGLVLRDQGTRIASETGTRLLAEAVAALRDALTVYTKEALPQNWAMTQNNLGTVLQQQGSHAMGEAGTRLFAESVTAYRAALTVYTNDQFPQQWATIQNNLGLVLCDQGTRIASKTGTHLLDEAVTAYRAALMVYTKEMAPQDWATTQNNLGNVLAAQGIRTNGVAGTKLLAEAVDAYRATLTVYRKEVLPQQWADTQNNLGIVLHNQGTRIGGDAGTQLLAEAVQAYRGTLMVYTKEMLPQQWTMAQENLAKAAFALKDWPTAAESSHNVLTLYPDHEGAYQSAHAIYHEKLFAYASAFDLTKQWVDRHPEGISVHANFAEVHLTMGRYEEAERRFGELLKKPELDLSSSVGLRVLEIANFLALKKAGTVPEKLRELRTFVSEQPETFHVGWSFAGTNHYVQSEQVFAPYRPWLMELFSIVESKDRAGLLSALDRVRSSFAP